MRVTVIGTGYVGAVTGACLAYLGHRVTCIDTDARKIARLRLGEPTIYEPYLAELLQLAAERGGIDFDTDLAQSAAASDVIFIAVGTSAVSARRRSQSGVSGSRRAQYRSRYGCHPVPRGRE